MGSELSFAANRTKVRKVPSAPIAKIRTPRACCGAEICSMPKLDDQKRRQSWVEARPFGAVWSSRHASSSFGLLYKALRISDTKSLLEWSEKGKRGRHLRRPGVGVPMVGEGCLGLQVRGVNTLP